MSADGSNKENNPHAEASLERAIIAQAQRLGFAACGIVKAEAVDETEQDYFRRWLAEGRQAGMAYLERNEAVRFDPRELFEGCRSLIVVILNYYPHERRAAHLPHIAYHAYGTDYHYVVKSRLEQLLAFVRKASPSAVGRCFCDTAPLLERYWAVRAGLGWVGRNRLLHYPGVGSYVVLGVLAVDIKLRPTAAYEARDRRDHSDRVDVKINATSPSVAPPLDAAPLDSAELSSAYAMAHTTADRSHCGTCRRCIDACPTGALAADGSFDARRCLAQLTFEHKGEMPPLFFEANHRSLYGCNICQDVCPHNHCATPTTIPEFAPTEAMITLDAEALRALTPAQFKTHFAHTALARGGIARLRRNLR